MSRLSFAGIGNSMLLALFLWFFYLACLGTAWSLVKKIELAFSGEKIEAIVYDYKYERIGGRRSRQIFHWHMVRRPSDDVPETRMSLDRKYQDFTAISLTCRSAGSIECVQGSLEDGFIEFLKVSLPRHDLLFFLFGLAILPLAKERYLALTTVGPSTPPEATSPEEEASLVSSPPTSDIELQSNTTRENAQVNWETQIAQWDTQGTAAAKIRKAEFARKFAAHQRLANRIEALSREAANDTSKTATLITNYEDLMVDMLAYTTSDAHCVHGCPAAPIDRLTQLLQRSGRHNEAFSWLQCYKKEYFEVCGETDLDQTQAVMTREIELRKHLGLPGPRYLVRREQDFDYSVAHSYCKDRKTHSSSCGTYGDSVKGEFRLAHSLPEGVRLCKLCASTEAKLALQSNHASI